MYAPDCREFEDLLLSRPLDQLLDEWVLNGPVHFFEELPGRQRQLEDHLSSRLPVSTLDYRIVGSAKTGFSLDPNEYPCPSSFSLQSDIDVVVVDAEAFDAIWPLLRKWGYWRRRDGAGRAGIGEALQYGVYSGWIEPDRIRRDALSAPRQFTALRDFAVGWFEAFQSLSLQPELAYWSVSGRLYRTWEFARLYHRDSLLQVRQRIEESRRRK